MLLSSIFVLLNQYILVLVLFVAMSILGIAGLPRILQAMRREPLEELQATDFSAPLRIREFLTWKGWFKLVSRWGIRKTMCLYSLIMTGVGAAIFFASSIFGIIRIAWAAAYTVIIGLGSAIFFHRQVGKALRKNCLAH